MWKTRVWLLNSDKILYEDVDMTAYAQFLLAPWVVEGFTVSKVGSEIVLSAGKALVLVTRGNGDQILVPLIAKEEQRIPFVDDKTIYLRVPQANIDNPSLNTSRRDIAELVCLTGVVTNSIKLGTTASGAVTVSKDMSGMTDSMFLKDIFVNGNINFQWEVKIQKPVNNDNPVDLETFEQGLASASSVSNLTDLTFPIGEDIEKNKTVYPEIYTNLSESTWYMVTFHSNDNKRVAFKIYWTWISTNKIKIVIARSSVLTFDLYARIEWINAGNPNWVSIASATITSASLSTTLSEYEITFSTSFTIAKSAIAFLVLWLWTYWSETIINWQYIKIWSMDKQTKLWTKSFWTSRTTSKMIAKNNTIQNSFSSSWNFGYWIRQWITITVSNTVFVKKVEVVRYDSNLTIYEWIWYWGTVIFNWATSSLSVNVNCILPPWTYTLTSDSTVAVMQTNLDVKLSPLWLDIQQKKQILNWVESNWQWRVTKIEFLSLWVKLPYIKSVWTSEWVYFKTKATYADFLDNKWITRITKVWWSEGQTIPIIFAGKQDWFLWLNEWWTYYFSDTEWEISLVAWTVSKKAWKAISDKQLMLPSLSISEL